MSRDSASLLDVQKAGEWGLEFARGLKGNIPKLLNAIGPLVPVRDPEESA
ncbi:hypothetical protein [Oscillatoria acuminata]|uniref:Uncharacterized protein n=1 Tax=Oscillatoria acuminata PCC 6304 TaxID=56110 RepID=K9TQ73_9CYAN|nr:hypothetical protein [Oscillatoria acuminata]AFY84281.1 hypothetical protein Oscil6304_4770 [Oscillatoria acuminata PCC 6304]